MCSTLHYHVPNRSTKTYHQVTRRTLS